MDRATLRNSIGTKLFAGFFAMSALLAGLGLYAHHVLEASNAIVGYTYDKPMMAINFARAATVDFLDMRNLALQERTASPSERAALAQKIDATAGTLSDDLDVAKERSTAGDERRTIAKIGELVGQWRSIRHAAISQGKLPELHGLDGRILGMFDMLVELNADHGFISRRQATNEIEGFGYLVMLVSGIAVFAALLITLFLQRRISLPLSAAARVADRIAAGEFDTPIPAGGGDETGALLKSMTVMQSNIAAYIARETARAHSAESRLMDAIESSGEGVVLCDPGGLVAIASSEVKRFFPNLACEIGTGKSVAAALHQIDQQCEAESEEHPPLSNLLSSGGRTAAAERHLPDGRWLRFTASRTSDGGTILFLSDFTDIKDREERYRAAKLQAEEASAAKTRFLSNMSHELRTPLNAIIGFSELMIGQIFGALSARYLEYTKDIHSSGRHLLDVINTVLELAKSDAGKLTISPKPIDLRVVLADCAAMLAGQYATADVSFEMKPLAMPVMIMGEEAKLRQIFLNLLSNAMKFTSAGGSVVVTPRFRDGGVVVEIADTGIGMSENDIEVALTPFAQVDNRRLERKYDGTGLGLPLAKSLTELHGGKLWIESMPAKGTSAFVLLPLPRAEAAPLSAAS